MIIRVKLNLNKLVSTTLTMSHAIGLGVTNKSNFATAYAEVATVLIASSLKSINTGINILTNNDMVNLSASGDYVIFDAEFNEETRLEEFNFLFINGFIEILDTSNKIYCYKQNSKNNVLNKSLEIVKIIDIQYKTTIALKSLFIDMRNYEFDYNYIYIPVLKRWYYVNSVEMMSKEITRLHLQEDVLMSWKELIKSQSAFVTRYENATNKKLYDERDPREDCQTVEYLSITNTSTGSKVNITLTTTYSADLWNFLVNVISWNTGATGTQTVNAPDTGLPTFSTPTYSPIENTYGLRSAELKYFYEAIVYTFGAGGNPSDFINSVIWVPFSVVTPYDMSNSDLDISLTENVKLVDNGEGKGRFMDIIGFTPIEVKRSLLCTSPYLVLSDFQFNYENDYDESKPIAKYEVYIAFVGWIEVDINEIKNSRLIIYYTLDNKSGNATAFLYNMTSHKLIYSTNCQLGVKLDITSTNALELSRERQSNQLNTILGLCASALSVGVGIGSQNPLAVVGGILTAGKTIAGAVNKNNQMFAKAQTTFGSGDASVHGQLATAIRKTYHKAITQDATVYAKMNGYPYRQYTALTALTGYVEIGEINFDLKANDIYQDEVQEIVQLLKNGVIF